jgi:deaminated glutathione amidase
MSAFKVACVQNCADDRIDSNIEIALNLSREAARAGAELICLPENFTCLEQRDDLYLSRGYTVDEHPALPAFKAFARELGVSVALGSLTVKLSGEKVANRSYVIAPSGDVVAQYDKIHLFDVQLRQGEFYRESNIVQSGSAAVTCDLPWTRLGLSICYDVRFARLYRALAQRGAKVLLVPAAFTYTTGSAHWHVLLRARAIETGSFVVAAAQCGTRPWGRRTYGHSLIVNPWGEVVADGGDEPGFILADIDPAKADEARAMIPALEHDREFTDP